MLQRRPAHGGSGKPKKKESSSGKPKTARSLGEMGRALYQQAMMGSPTEKTTTPTLDAADAEVRTKPQPRWATAEWTEAGADFDPKAKKSKFKQGHMELKVAKGLTAPEDLDTVPNAADVMTFDHTSEEYLAALQIDANQAQEKLIQYLSGSIYDASYKEPDEGKEKTRGEQIRETFGHKSLSVERREELYPTKKNARIHEKASKYTKKGGGYECFTDIARGSLIFDSPEKLLAAKKTIVSQLAAVDMRIVNEKNRFKGLGTDDDHYRDFLLNVEVPIGDKPTKGKQATHVVELQLHLKDMVAAKSNPTKSIDPQRYGALRASAFRLYAAHNDNSSPIEFSSKALHSLEEIRSAAGPADIDNGTDKKTGEAKGAGLSGHHLYNVKRYLFEHEEELNKKGASQKLTSEWRIWSKVAAEDMYDPAWQKAIQDTTPETLKQLQTLTFR